MSTFNDLLAKEAAMAIHLLAGRYLDQGLTMEQTLEVLHKAVELVPELEKAEDAYRQRLSVAYAIFGCQIPSISFALRRAFSASLR